MRTTSGVEVFPGDLVEVGYFSEAIALVLHTWEHEADLLMVAEPKFDAAEQDGSAEIRTCTGGIRYVVQSAAKHRKWPPGKKGVWR